MTEAIAVTAAIANGIVILAALWRGGSLLGALSAAVTTLGIEVHELRTVQKETDKLLTRLSTAVEYIEKRLDRDDAQTA